MKYIIVLGDGMADEPILELGLRTPLEAAVTPALDALSLKSEIGLVRTIPKGRTPGSDPANLSVLGYDPVKYYSGRSPLEALSIGVAMESSDVAIRCNFVTLSDETGDYENRTILDHSSGDILTEECLELLEAIKSEMETENYQFYAGTSYRHCLIWKSGQVDEMVPPHDILGRVIGDKLPQNSDLRQMMKKSFQILDKHPLNQKRALLGLRKANSIWFWGAGTAPCLTSFHEKTKKKGAMVAAVDLLKGIAVGTGMKVVSVPGATGTLHTNYEGKANAALKVLLEENYDFVYIHVEAPDEMGHQGSIVNKIKAIEYLDDRLIRIVKEGMDQSGEPYRMMVLPDHPTPICYRTHTDLPVPYLLYDSRHDMKNHGRYSEKEAGLSGILIQEGHTLIDRLLEQ